MGALLTPEQIELAHAHLVPWLGSRSRVTVSEAAQATLASMTAAFVPAADRGAATPRPIATLLRLKGFYEGPTVNGDTVFVRRGTQSAERQRGLSYARQWRERTKPEFDALFGEGGEA
jgi:hypothetical protein